MLHLIVLTLLHSYKRIIIKKKKVQHKQINQIHSTPIQRIKIKNNIKLHATLYYSIRSHAHMPHRHRHKAKVTSA
jgi:hypothetical protein